MTSGWSRFKSSYDYTPAEDKEIALAKGDVLVVAKPYEDPQGWLVGRNDRTGEYGEFPGTYVKYIGDLEELAEAAPEVPPPRPPKPKTNRGDDYIWGTGKQFYKCTDCDLSCHYQCAWELERFPCYKKKELEDEENGYVHLVSSVEEWAVEDVMSWLAATHFYTFAETFREYGIDGSKLKPLDEESLVQLGVVDHSHQQSLLYAIEELINGSSASRESEIFNGYQRANSGSTGDHELYVKSFTSLQWCDRCGKCMWGLYEQGLQCSVCGLCCHRMCKADNIPVCPRRRVKGSRDMDVDVPVFGQDLGPQFRPSSKPAPIGVIKCVEAIEERGLSTEGIYKITSTGSGKYSLRSALNQDPGHVNMKDEEWRNPHCVAAVLKMYFQELPKSLFTQEKYAAFIQICKSNEADCVEDLLNEIDSLPKENKSVIRYFMKHLFKVSKNQEKNRMPSKSLAIVFSSILLRPNQQEIMKLALNHEIQIRVLDILIREGPWSKQQLPQENPPVVPPRPARVGSVSSRQSSLESSATPATPDVELKKAVWYWGQASKETVNERIRDTEDGTFIVRDSKRFPGEYTLTLMKGGVSKLIRIMYKNDKYGFSDPLVFNSIIELVDYYGERSLSQYNPKLDVKLSHPLSKYEQDEGLDEGFDAYKLMENLEQVDKDFQHSSGEYNELYKNYADLTQEISELQVIIEAQRTVVSVIEEQLHLHEAFQREAPPQHRGLLRTNYELLKHRLTDAQVELLASEREMSNKAESNRQADKRMNSLRPQIIELQRNRQAYMAVLEEKGMTYDEVKEFVNEGAYQVPDVDISEKHWKFGRISRNEAARLLQNRPDGTFLIRESINTPGGFSVSLAFDCKVRHIAIVKGPRGFGFAEKFLIHPTLKDLVIHYHSNTLQKHNEHLATKLAIPLRWLNNDSSQKN